jgi:hypothetical protein
LIQQIVLDKTRERLRSLLKAKEMRTDPLAWCEYMLGSDYMPYKKLREAFESFNAHRRSLCWGINASGKTFSLLGILSLWWWDTHGRNSKVMIVTPSFKQSKNAIGYVSELDAVIRARYDEGIIDHTVGGRVIKDVTYQETGVGSGWIRAENPIPQKAAEVIKGAHSTGGTLIILEEAQALSDKAVRGAKNVLTGGNDKMIAIANPTNPDSYVMRLVKRYVETGIASLGDDNDTDAQPWGMTKIAWEDMPAFTGENVPELQRINLAKPEYVNDVIGEHGIDSPEYRIYVLAEPDYESEMSIVRASDIYASHNVEYPRSNNEPRCVLGVDLALYGKKGDDSVIYASWTKPITVREELEDGRISEYIQMITSLRFIDSITTNDVSKLDQARWVVKTAIAHDACDVRFDAQGMGADFIDLINIAISELDMSSAKIAGNVTFSAMRGQGGNLDKDIYANDRTAWFGIMRNRMAAGEIDLDPEDNRLTNELLSIKYKQDIHGRMKIVAKRDMSKSPDYADAAVFCCLHDDHMAALSGHTIADDVLTYSAESDEFVEDYDAFSDDPWLAYFPLDE